MSTQTTAITLTTSTYVTNAAGNTVITTGAAVVNPTYTAGVIQSFTNFGTLDSTGTGNGGQSSGIDITLGDATGAHSALGNAGLVTGYDYGIYLSAHNATSVPVDIFNVGTILGRASTAHINAGTLRSSGIFAGQNVVATIDNDGVIQGGEGIWLLTNDSGTQSINNDAGARILGTTSENGNVYGIKIQDNNNGLQGTGIVNNAGYVGGLIDIAAKYVDLTNQSTGTITGGIFALGSGELDLIAGGTVNGGAVFRNGANNGLNLGLSTIVLNGTTTTVGQLTDPGAYQGFGFITVAAGSTWLLGTSSSSAGFASVSTISDFGTIDLAGGLNGNTIDMEGSVAGTATEVDFTGSNSSTPLVDYGTNDKVVFSTLAGPAGTTYQDSYNTATGVLTVTEISSTGATIGSSTATISGAPGTTLNSGSFVDINGPNGETIVLGSSSLANQGSIYLNYGASATLSNTAIDTVPVTFGNSAGTNGVLNTLDINGTVAGTNSPYQGAISGFGLNDDIILGPSVLPSVASGDSVTLSYAGSLLTVTELNSAGASIGSTTIDVGTGYAANSFVALLGTNGVNIETPQTVDEQSFKFGPLTSGTGYQGDFENPNDYQGKLAPGATIVSGETVTVEVPAQANVTSPLTNNGLIVLNGLNSNLDATAAISGNGTIEVANGAKLTLANPTGTTTDTIAFAGSGAVLDLTGTGTASFGGTITGFTGTDSIDLGGSFLPTPTASSAVTLNYNSTTGALTVLDTVGGTVYTDTLHIAAPVPGTFAASISNGQIVISDVPCFAAGTRILTADGQKPVESLKIGDHVLTIRDGSEQHIVWTGSRTVDLSRHAYPEKAQPVVILAGAFGEGLPERDLKLSPDHALYIDGHLVEAKTLVNGATILRDRATRFVTYHHIELERHDVVLAEGMAAETYLDSGNRLNFDSDAGPIALHPDFAAASRAGACATLVTDGPVVRQLRQKLLDRAVALGFGLTDTLELTAKAGAEVIEAIADTASGAQLFILPAAASAVTLRSATGVPAEISADPSDRRELGVAIAALVLVANGKRIAIDLNDPAHTGLYDAEPGQRWTNGAARIALPAHSGRAILEVTLNGQARRWRRTGAGRTVSAG